MASRSAQGFSADEASQTMDQDAKLFAGGQRFTTTHWTVVLRAKAEETQVALAALEALCQRYRKPLERWLVEYLDLHGGLGREAPDILQSFFLMLIRSETIQKADPAKGRFRDYLRVALKRFAITELQRQNALKRGGNCIRVSLDETPRDGMQAIALSHDEAPDWLYDRQWALAVLEDAMARLEAASFREGKGALFEKIKGQLTCPDEGLSYEAIGDSLGMSSGAVKVALHRLRKRYGHIVWEVVSETVEDPADVADEVRWLLSAVSTPKPRIEM